MTPPRKVSKAPKKAQKEKLRAPTQKKKLLLKTPTILKIKIPLQNSSSADIEFIKNVDKANEDISQQQTSKKAILVEKNALLCNKKEVTKIVTRKKPIASQKRAKKNKDVTVKKKCRSKRLLKADEGSIKEESVKYNMSEVNENFLNIMLANEVVNLQFENKHKFEEKLPNPPILQTSKTNVNKKQISNKKNVLKKNTPNEEPTAINDGPGMKTRKRCGRKKVPVCCTNSTEESKDNHNTKTKSSEGMTGRKRKLNNKAGNKKLRNNSISILNKNMSNNETLSNDDTEAEETDKVIKGGKFYELLDGRESVACSEKSSSSSCTSLLTVVSKDLYLIDNKIPVLQLNNIDVDLKNNKNYLSYNCGTCEGVGLENRFGGCAVNKEDKVNENLISYSSLNRENILSDASSTTSNRRIPVSDFNNLQISVNANRLNVKRKSDNCAMSKENNIDEINTPYSSLNLSSSSTSSSSTSSCSDCTSASTSVASNDHLLANNTDKTSEIINDKTNTEPIVPVPVNYIDTPSSSFNINSVSIIGRKCNDERTNTSANKCNNVGTNIKKLALNIKTCDINLIKWSQNISEDTNGKSTNTTTDVKKLQDKIFNDGVLHESNLIRLCLSVSELFSNDYQNPKIHDVEQKYDEPTAYGSPPRTFNSQESYATNDVRKKGYDEFCVQNNHTIQQQNPHKGAVAANNIEYRKPGDALNENNSSSNQINCTSFEENDDDDALSLFAESLTGLESYRRSSNVNSGNDLTEIEEYIPRPLFKHALQPPPVSTYKPSKINYNHKEEANKKYTSVCEKQNADSTSPYTESIHNNTLFNEDRAECGPNDCFQISNTGTNNLVSNAPRLMALTHKPFSSLKSLVFKDCCFFNLTTLCKRRDCKFPHTHLNVQTVKNTLSTMSEQSFIQEYMLLRIWPNLRNRYGIYFVEECIRRDLTRILIEMTIDFIENINDAYAEGTALKKEVVDSTLLHLNSVDLSACDDLLRYNVKSADGIPLCDKFMIVIATSENFSRFKTVFINLTRLIASDGRKFCVEVAESVLERLCILPYDEALAQALVVIMTNTDVIIFANSKIGNFENILCASNKELYEKFKTLKENATVRQRTLVSYDLQTFSEMDVDNVINTNSEPTDKNTRYSPDTTALDNANKNPTETKFTRTINFNKITVGGAPKLKQDIKMYDSKEGYKKWMNRSIFDNLQNFNTRMGAPKRLPPRIPSKRLGDQHFEGSPTVSNNLDNCNRMGNFTC